MAEAWGDLRAALFYLHDQTGLIDLNDSTTMNRPKRLYTVRQVAKIAGVSIRTIRDWIERGKLPTRQQSGPGGVHLIDLEDLYDQQKEPNNGRQNPATA